MLRLGLDDPVLIIGAGICGLAIAHGLQQANIPYLIFETEHDTDCCSRDWPVALGSSVSLLKQLLPPDLADRLKTHAAIGIGCDDGSAMAISASDSVTDEHAGKIKPAGEYLRTSKTKLKALLQEGIGVRVSEDSRLGCCGKFTAE